MDNLEKMALKYFDDCQNGCNNLIDVKDLYEKLKQNEDLFLLDIRKREDFGKEHIEGSVNIFWYELGEFLDVIPKDQKVIVICYSGQSAGQIVGVLKMLGYDACSLKGGMNNGWLKEAMPIEAACGS